MIKKDEKEKQKKLKSRSAECNFHKKKNFSWEILMNSQGGNISGKKQLNSMATAKSLMNGEKYLEKPLPSIPSKTI